MTSGGTGPGGTLDPIEAVMDEVRRYLAEHPHATDSIQGVHAFWLAGSGAKVSAEVLQAALDRLTGAGVLEARRVPGGDVVYGAPGDRRSRG